MDLDVLGRYPDNKLVIATTGSQGEPMSALTRMAMNDHRKITVTEEQHQRLLDLVEELTL